MYISSSVVTATRTQGSGNLSLQDSECPGPTGHSPHPGRLWADELSRPHTQRSCSQCAPLLLTGGLCTSGVAGAPYPSQPTNPLATICPGPALLPTHLPFLLLSQLGKTPGPTQAPAAGPAPDARPPSLTCDNMTTLRQPAPHFREPRQRSSYAIPLYRLSGEDAWVRRRFRF